MITSHNKLLYNMPISKDRQTSRRKRATGFFKKASEIPEVELFIVMKYRGTQEIKTYDWTSGRILDELPKLIDQLVSILAFWPVL